MISKIGFRALAIVGVVWSMGSACASESQGTDSNTHWIVCDTVADCPNSTSYACVAHRCEPASADSGAPSAGGDCPPGAAGTKPCDGRVAQCWTPCTQGFRGQLVCDADGTWTAGHGLFPCGPDGGQGGSGGKTPGAGGIGNGGGASSGGASGTGASTGGTAGTGASGTGGSAGSPVDAGSNGPDGGDPCAPMDAHTGNLPCVGIVGYAWTGTACASIVCSCDGADCGSMYTTEAECRSAHAACVIQGVSTACQHNSDCTLVNRTCCLPCGEPGITDKVAVNVASVSIWNEGVCRNSGACPPCVPPPGPFQAECFAGQCQTTNLNQYKGCLQSQDCEVRPVDCCACGTLTKQSDVIAINSSSTYFPVCPASCPACPGGVELPPNVTASCYLGGAYCVLE